MNSHRTLCVTCVLITCLAGGFLARAEPASTPTPIILDTDIGDDIDDTWALGLALRSPELDVKLVVGDYGSPTYRAKLIGKFLTVAGRTDVAVGVGMAVPAVKGDSGRQAKFIEGYDLASYPGKVHPDGVQAIVDTIMASPRPMTLVCIGPAPNIAEALRREPRIAQKARFVGIYGSVRVGYGGSKKISAEWNVKADAKAAQAALQAPWDVTITPLDTCGLIVLKGAKYAAVRDSKDPIAAAIIENYRYWAAAQDKAQQAEEHSKVIYDTVAVYLAFSTDCLKIEQLPIRVTDDGLTVIDNAGKTMNVATEWKDIGAFEDLLVRRLTQAAR